MKKKHKRIIIIFTLLIFFLMVGYYLIHYTVYIGSAKSGDLTFIHNENNISDTLSEQDLLKMKKMFNWEMTYMDAPSCGFLEEVSVKFDDSHTFYFACDTCPIVYWKEKNTYFNISEKEQKELYEMLGRYGFYFPCV